METFILTLARGLAGVGHTVSIVTTDSEGEWFCRASEVGACSYFVQGLECSSHIQHAYRVGEFLRDARFDVIINNYSWFVQASLGMLSDEAIAISVIHNAPRQIISTSCSNERACHAFVAPSKCVLELAGNFLHGIGKLVLIPHGVQVPNHFEERSGAPDRLRVVYCGRLDQCQKGVLLLPSIIARTRTSGCKVTLDAIGDGPSRGRLEELIAEMELGEYIHLQGASTHDSALEYLKHADVVIMPSFFEAFGFSLIEGMANGCIPVVSLLPGVTDWIVEDGRSGFVIPIGDVEGFSRALAHLARNPTVRSRMSYAAWTTARDRFTVGAMVNSYLDLIGELCLRPICRKGLPRLAPDLITWKDWLPHRARRTIGNLRRTVVESFAGAG